MPRKKKDLPIDHDVTLELPAEGGGQLVVVTVSASSVEEATDKALQKYPNGKMRSVRWWALPPGGWK